MQVLLLVTLTAVGQSATVDFDTDVLPILTKSGCNAAACHGAAAGRGGFKLSLFGGDPAADHQAIVSQLEGRRINLVRPEDSLLIAKPTAVVDHEGGLRFDYDSWEAEQLAEWIRAGASRQGQRRLQSLDVQPSTIVVAALPASIPLRVVAEFSDPAWQSSLRRDVTGQAMFAPTDPAALEVEPQGSILVRRPGRHSLVVRYLNRVETVQVTAPLSDRAVDFTQAPRSTWIDELILQTLGTLRLPLSPRAGDATLLRRVSLDLTGRLPTPDQLRRYLSNQDPGKYSALVDRLLQSDEFSEYWTYKFAKLFRIHAPGQDKQGALAFHRWVRSQLESGTGLDQMARALLTAEGDTHTEGPANFYRIAAGPRAQAEYVSEVLMGVRLRCANCHNHPLDRWTQDDYHGLAAIFARLDQGRIIRVNARGQVTNPRTGVAATARIPGQRYLPQQADGRQALAQWLTHPDNPFFAKAQVNRLWKAMMGRGLFEPTDDLRATNQATHPELLNRLAEDFARQGYNVRHTLRLIARSAAYQRSSQPLRENRMDDRFYSHWLSRPLEAEVLADALADVTGVADRYGDFPLGTRAVSLFDPQIPSQALDILGRCSREDSCEAAPAGAAGLSARLHMMNGPLINRKIRAPLGRLQQQLEAGRASSEIVEDFYQLALTRHPRQQELAYWKRELVGADQRQRIEDFVWSLLTCREFTTNH